MGFRNRKHARDYQRQWYWKNIAKARERSRLKQYKMNKQRYRTMFLKQNGLCAICGMLPDRIIEIDHDHRTGKVRELLCSNCNRGLGNFKDNSALLQLAAQYLRRHESNE